MKDQPIYRDERTISVENASYRFGYLFLSFGLLVIVAFRSFFYKESNWDLMGLVILGGLVTTVYQAFHKTLSRRLLVVSLATAVVAALVAFVIVLIQK